MDSAKWNKVREIFEAVGGLTPSKRENRLSTPDKNLDEREIITEVRRLLRAENDLTGFDETPFINLHDFEEDCEDIDLKEFIGKTSGKYCLCREIGRGGMGIVYETLREEDEFRRRSRSNLYSRK